MNVSDLHLYTYDVSLEGLELDDDARGALPVGIDESHRITLVVDTRAATHQLTVSAARGQQELTASTAIAPDRMPASVRRALAEQVSEDVLHLAGQCGYLRSLTSSLVGEGASSRA